MLMQCRRNCSWSLYSHWASKLAFDLGHVVPAEVWDNNILRVAAIEQIMVLKEKGADIILDATGKQRPGLRKLLNSIEELAIRKREREALVVHPSLSSSSSEPSPGVFKKARTNK